MYLAGQAAVTVALGIRPYSSVPGIAWLAATALVMFVLAYGKARTGLALDHSVLRAESKVTLVDAALATATLAGLSLRAAAGWWWADVAAGMVIVVYGLSEARHLLRPSP